MISDGCYCLQCVGGPFDGQFINYPDVPARLVLMDQPFRYHEYHRQGDTSIYAYRGTTTGEDDGNPSDT